MTKFILGLKLGMSQIFDEKGNVIPVTVIGAGPCQVTQIKKEEKDKYKAVQIGFERLKKTQKQKPFRYLREFRIKDVSKYKNLPSAEPCDASHYKVGDKIDVSIFQKGEKVKISAISKGKGFQGVVKRWGFAGMPASHGTKHELRTLGSVGAAFPERVIKGKKMPGRMGGARVTVKNLEVVKVDPENNLFVVKGAVSGRKGQLLEIRSGI